MAFFMLLPVTTTSQTLRGIIDNSPHRDLILSLITKWYFRATIEENWAAVYKDTWIAAGVTTSTRVWVWGVFNMNTVSDITLVAASDTTVILDLNAS